MRLQNKIALITGAGKGIGKAIALGFAKKGATVILNELAGSTYVEDVADEIRALGQKSEVIYAEIGNVAAIKAMFANIQENYGRLDILVNNAGITGWSDVFDTSEEIFDKVINTNLKGTFFCSVEAAKIMRTHGGGSIINISTVCSHLSVKNLVIYSASKGGIHSMQQHLATEFAPYNIRINTFGPGAINVERNLNDDPDYKSNWGGVIPMQRTGEPEEMVGPAVFLASDDSSYVTGQLFFVDGGWTIQGKIPENSMDRQLSSFQKK